MLILLHFLNLFSPPLQTLAAPGPCCKVFWVFSRALLGCSGWLLMCSEGLLGHLYAISSSFSDILFPRYSGLGYSVNVSPWDFCSFYHQPTQLKMILFLGRLCVQSQHPFAHFPSSSTNRSLWEPTGSIKALKWAAGGQCRGVIFSKLGWINTSNQQWEQWNRTAP